MGPRHRRTAPGTEVTTVGGDHHVVRLRADTGAWRDIVFQSLRNGELPDLPAG